MTNESCLTGSSCGYRAPCKTGWCGYCLNPFWSLPIFVFIAVINTIPECNVRRKGMAPPFNSRVTEVGQEQKQRPWRNAVYWLALSGLICCLSHPRTIWPGMVFPTVSWAFPPQSSVKTKPPQTHLLASLTEASSQLGFFLPEWSLIVSGWQETKTVTTKQTSHLSETLPFKARLSQPVCATSCVVLVSQVLC